MSKTLKRKAKPLAEPAPMMSPKRRRTESLRVLMLAPTAFFSDYGCHVRILEEARALEAKGVEICICTYHRGRDLPGLHIARIPTLPWGSHYAMGSSWHKVLFDALLLARSILAYHHQRPDLIHAFLHEGALVGRVLARWWRVPLVFDYQGSLTGEMIDHGFLRSSSIVHRGLYRLETWINDLPDAIVSSSAHAAMLLPDTFGCRCQRIHTVPDCVDTTLFRPIPTADRDALRRQLALSPNVRIVGYLGKLASYQGVDMLLQAATQLVPHYPHLHFLIMGYPSVDTYRARAEQLGIARYVTFTGRIPYEDAPRYLSLVDVAVAPKLSLTEGNGKLLNYMAMGLPTVAFDTPVAHEYLGPWGCYAERSPDGLAHAIATLLEQPNSSIGLHLRRRAMERFSREKTGQAILSVYEKVLAAALGAHRHVRKVTA